jgi:hypothetical protein
MLSIVAALKIDFDRLAALVNDAYAKYGTRL